MYFVIMDVFKTGRINVNYYSEDEVDKSPELKKIVENGPTKNKRFQRSVIAFKDEKDALKFVARRKN